MHLSMAHVSRYLLTQLDMNSIFAASFFSERLLKTISWTLVHSLWQGLAIALLAAFILLATPGRKALLRYNLYCPL
jgi:hypothetical protein